MNRPTPESVLSYERVSSFWTSPASGSTSAPASAFSTRSHRWRPRPWAHTVILVTHHVEEIPPAVSHVLLLKGGAVLAAGPKEGVLTQAAITRAFDTALELHVRSGRYSVHPLPTEHAHPLA